MTNPMNVVCSTDDYLLSVSDDPQYLYVTRRDGKEFDCDYDSIATDMFHSYIFWCMMQADKAQPVIANYSFALSDDKKVIRIEIASQDEISTEKSVENSDSTDSEEDSAPTPEEIAELLERKRKQKTIWYKLKKLFGK